MSPKESSQEIKKLLDALPSKKTARERLSLITVVKCHVEQMQDLFRKERQKELSKEKAAATKKHVIKGALKQMLAAFDKIHAQHEELGDTDLRERMYDAIDKGFISATPGYTLPTRFGMFSEKADQLVCAALQRFLTHPQVIAARQSLKTPQDRLEAFQDFDVQTTEGTNTWEYFGFKSKPH
jgi:hypothetical protein